MIRTRWFITLAMLSPVLGAAQICLPESLAKSVTFDIFGPKDLNSISGIERELRKLRLLGKKPGFLEAYFEFFKARAFPNETFDWDQYRLATQARGKLDPIRKHIKGNTDDPPVGNWSFVGPLNTNPRYQTFFGDRPIMGRVNALAMPPNPNRQTARSQIVYAATAGGGVWRTTDNGATWNQLTDLSARWTSLQVGAIAVTNATAYNPQSNNDIIIAGTGDPRGIYRLYSFGVMRSTDGGATWEAPKLLGGGAQTPPTSIMVDPDQPNRITLCTGGAATATGSGDNRYPPPSTQDYRGSIWQSTDYGQTWNQVFATNAYWSRVSYSAKGGDGIRRYWASGWDGAGNAYVMVSTNRGQNWNNVTPGGLNVGTVNSASLDLCGSKTNPRVAYLVSGQNQSIYMTTDGGTNWNPINTNNASGFPNQYFNAANDNWGQSSYDYYIEAVPIPGGYKDMLLCGLITLAAGIRNDATNQWTWLDIGQTGTGGALIHNDQHCAVYDVRDSRRVFVGHDGGMHQLQYNHLVPFAAGAFAFTNRSNGLNITQYYEGAWHPTTANAIIGGAQDNMSSRSIGAGGATINNWQGEGGGDGAGSTISYSNPNIQTTLANITGFYVTNDGWTTSSQFNLVSSGNNSFFPPTMMDVLGNYYWCDDSANQYTTNGANLNIVYTSAILTGGTAGAYVTAIANPYADPDRVYVGASDGAVWYTRNATNAAPAWSRLDRQQNGTNLPNNPNPPARYVTDIAVDPINPDRIVVSYSGIGTAGAPVTDHVYRCDNTQATDANRQWALCDSGGNKLPNVPINTLTFDLTPNPPIPANVFAEANPDIAIPDNDPVGVSSTINIANADAEFNVFVAVRVVVSGTWNGDIYCKLEHAGERAVLINGTGRDGGPPGYNDDGFDCYFDDDPGNIVVQGDVHTYRTVTGVLPPGTPLGGTWQSDGRDVPIATVANASPRTKRLDVFQNKPTNGAWTLTVSDNAGLDNHRLVRWELFIRGFRPDGTPVNRVYAGGDAGMFYTNDITANPVVWTNATQPIGLPNVQVNDIEHVLGTGLLNAATFGRGMWRVNIGGAELGGAICQPNRFQGGGNRTTTLRVVLSKPAPGGGAVVNVASSHPALLTVPGAGNINIAAGQVTGTMVLTSANAPGANTPVTITARYGTEKRQTVVHLAP